MPIVPTDDLFRAGVTIDEWLFVAWLDDGSLGLLSGHRVVGNRAWYWTALAVAGRPLLHLYEWEVAVRHDRFVVKAPEMWAEHQCVAALEQWTIGNEGYATAVDDPAEMLGRGYGTPTAMAMDLEWYATAPATEEPEGFRQSGVVHGTIEIAGRAPLHLTEIGSTRWRRWTSSATLGPVLLPPAGPHNGLRVPFVFPDGAVTDWMVTPDGWMER